MVLSFCPLLLLLNQSLQARTPPHSLILLSFPHNFPSPPLCAHHPLLPRELSGPLPLLFVEPQPRGLLLGRKAMTNLDSILKSRDITLPTKVRIVKAVVFPAVVYSSESWTIKKAEHRRIDAFELWCWRRLLRVRWTARRSNQSILKEISPEYSLKGLKLKL